MYEVAILTVSDRSYQGEREDLAGPELKRILENNGYKVADISVVPDEMDKIKEALINYAKSDIPLVVTTGGTGFSPRDITPEATIQVCDRLTPGIPEAMRKYSSHFTNRAYLSRSAAGIRDKTLIVNLPGSPKSLKENLDGILPFLDHGLDMLRGGQADCAGTSK